MVQQGILQAVVIFCYFFYPIYFVTLCYLLYLCRRYRLTIKICMIMENLSSFEIAFLERKQELFTMEEVAKWCGMTRNALYQHYRRGHIKPEILGCHRLYFTREAILDFVTNYRPVL